MAAIAQANLFSWDAVEARSDLDRLKLVLAHLPDERVVQYLEVMRGHGRDDYPVRAMWHALLAGIVFQHESPESLLRELARNPSLMDACGFAPLPIQRKPKPRLLTDPATGVSRIAFPPPAEPVRAVPSSWNFSRFLAHVIELEETLGMISEMSVILREQLLAVLPDFGAHLGFDGTDIASHSTGQKARPEGLASDPDADWGHHETHGIDTRYEIPVAFEVTPASVSEQPTLRAMIRTTFAETKALLWDDYAIRPLIDTRELWREEKDLPDYDPSKPITRPLDPARADTIVHTEKGSVHCVCPVSGEQRDLAFQGFEADRNTLKYRCPAAAYGLECQGQNECHQAGAVSPGEYGRVVRIKLDEHDRRIFVPTPYGSPSWQRGYNRRSALERINNRIDRHFCFEQHFICGLAKMTTRVGLAIAVMMAMALGHIRQGRPEQMRSLVQPIPATG